MWSMVLRLLLPLFAIGPGAWSQQLPSISWVSQQQVVDLGDNVQFHCIAPYSAGYPVLWLRQEDAVPLSTGCTRIVPETRFLVDCQRDLDTYSLTIEEVQETDAGWYVCLVMLDSTNLLAAETQVVVRVPPYILDSSTHFEVAVEGASVTLHCFAKGFPAPKLVWRRKDSAPLQGGASVHWGGELELQNVSRSDAGTYECVADNAVGRAAHLLASVQVASRPRVWASRPRVGQALGHFADLLCFVEGYPPPVVFWSHNSGHPLVNNQHYRWRAQGRDCQHADGARYPEESAGTVHVHSCQPLRLAVRQPHTFRDCEPHVSAILRRLAVTSSASQLPERPTAADLETL